MSDPTTLDALYRAAVASPEDRTVRLVYADALDETDDAADAARAEFIRAQVEVEAAAARGHGRGLLKERSRELFGEHWLDWWRPVCELAGLPVPHRTGRQHRRVRGRSPKRPENWPYTHTAQNTSVQLADYGLSVQFAGGFPEEVRFLNFAAPENGPELVHRWGDAMPLVRLAFAAHVAPYQWDRISGPHLARLADLTFDLLTDDTAERVVESRRLAAVTRLSVNPIDYGTVQTLFMHPPWAGLRSLRVTGRLAPEALRTLAVTCTLPQLEEADLTLGNPGELGGQIGQLLTGIIRMFTQSLALAAASVPRWPEFGPALEALAGAPWVRRLRRLRISAGGPHGLLGMIGERLHGTADRGIDLLPDSSVVALADAVNTERLERLTLPAAVVSPPVREAVVSRLGDRVTFA